MKKIKSHLWKGALCLLAAAFIVTLLLSGHGLRLHEPEPLASQTASIRPEGQGAEPIEDSSEPEETEPTEPTEPSETEPPAETEPSEATEPTEPSSVSHPGETEPTEPSGSGGASGDDGGGGNPTEGPSDDSKPAIITDLANCEITYDQLEQDVLHFYAYLLNAPGQTLKVKLRNSTTPFNGQYLTGDGRDYRAVLCRNETNYFTLYRKSGNVTLQEVTYAVRYVARKADSEHPTVGEHPPVIVTNLEGVTETTNRNFTLTVRATAYTGKDLYASSLEVRMDGKRITQPTGGPIYEYQLYFPDPVRGDFETHTITVRAWDGEGNSTFVSYQIVYRFVDTGDVTGTAYIVLDATTVGLDIFEEPYAYQIRQNVPASYAVIEALEEYGYEYLASGTPDTGFYLRRISRGGMMDYPAIPENLWAKVLADGLTLTGLQDSNSLGEFDYTQGSGWMYSVGGETYAGKGLSTYYLSNGDTLYLRFTLAYGKDIGGYSATAGSFGLLESYCGRWINGAYLDEHRWGQPQQTLAPDCTHPGEACETCTVCGDTRNAQELPALGHDYQETDRQEPADGQDGWIRYTCTRCGEQKEEPIPWKKDPDLPDG